MSPRGASRRTLVWIISSQVRHGKIAWSHGGLLKQSRVLISIPDKVDIEYWTGFVFNINYSQCHKENKGLPTHDLRDTEDCNDDTLE